MIISIIISLIIYYKIEIPISRWIVNKKLGYLSNERAI